MAEGMYQIIKKENGGFNIKPKDSAQVIPEDQRQIHKDIYRAYNALMLMVDHKVFAQNDPELATFLERLLEAAEVGLGAQNARTRDAASAVKDIQANIVTRKGKPLVYSYLTRLGLWALGGLVVAALAHAFMPATLTAIKPYSLVLCGAMVGAWLSIASTRTSVGLDTIHEFLDYGREPVVRLVFVALLAVAITLFLQEQLITIKIGTIDLASFKTNGSVAVILGLIIGITEKALSLKFFERAKSYVVS